MLENTLITDTVEANPNEFESYTAFQHDRDLPHAHSHARNYLDNCLVKVLLNGQI